MSHPSLRPAPDDRPSEGEGSEVRVRTPPAPRSTAARPSGAPTEAAPYQPLAQALTEVLETEERWLRAQRLEQLGARVLETLSPTDPRARLLQMALTRRDHLLVEGVLHGLVDTEQLTDPARR